jgi:acyl carrier protein
MPEKSKDYNEVSEFVDNILVFNLGVEDCDLHDEAAFDDLGVDSLDVTALLLRSEGEFGIEIEPNDYEKMETLEGFKTLVAQYKKAVSKNL